MLIKDSKQDLLRIFLCYDDNNNPVINGIKKISKPGCRNYVSSTEIPNSENTKSDEFSLLGIPLN